MRLISKIALTGFFVLFFCGNDAFLLANEPIKMRIVIVNPSQKKPQFQDVKTYLPKEIHSKDIEDTAGLNVQYDDAQGMFFVYKEGVEIAPGETKVFEIVLKDVWIVPDAKMDELKKRTTAIMDHLKDTPYFSQADLVAQTIYGRLQEISKVQQDTDIRRDQHIANYRLNLETLVEIKADIESLEKILVAVGGPPNPKLMEDSKVDLKSPTTKTTWIIVFVILIFLGIMAVAFYFNWQGQAKMTENIFTKEKGNVFSDLNPSKAKDKETDEPEEKKE